MAQYVKYILHMDKYKRLFLQKILQKSYEASEHFQHGVGIFIQTYYLKKWIFPARLCTSDQMLNSLAITDNVGVCVLCFR